MILHRKTIDGTTNATTTVNMATLFDDAGITQYLCDFNIEVTGNDASVTMKAKGTFADSEPADVTNGTIAINGGHVVMQKSAIAEFQFTTTGSAYKIMITRQLESV